MNNITPINNAFDFESTIKPKQILTNYSTYCIYCNTNQTVPLIPDGSFRRCVSCRKDFKAQFITKQMNPSASEKCSYRSPLFPTMRPNYEPIDKKAWSDQKN